MSSFSLENLFVLALLMFRKASSCCPPHMQSDRSPRLVTNSLVWVPQGGMLQISKTILHAEVPGARDSEITYNIIKDQPRHGKFLWSFIIKDQL